MSFYSSANTGVTISKSPKENAAYEFVLHQQFPSFLARRTWMICEMGGKMPYSCFFFVMYCSQDMFKTECNILLFPPSFFYKSSG